jgi:hypothetical protein
MTLTAPAQGSIEFAPATAGITLQLAPFFKGDKGDSGGELSAIAVTTLSGHIAVTLDGAGQAVAADNSIATHGGSVVGITTGAAALGASVSIADKGTLEHLGWAFTPNQAVYLGAAGQITQTPPTGQFIKVLGMAKTATRITISIQPAIYVN